MRRLYSWQREWLARREAEHLEGKLIAHRELVKRMESTPAATLLEAIERKMDAAESWMELQFGAMLFSDVDLTEMPANPP